MRYIADSNGYIKEISFGAMIECGGIFCVEYTGSVPSGYDSLESWFLAECENLYRWKIVGGELTYDGNVIPPVDVPPYAPSGYGLGGKSKEVMDWNDAKANGWYCSYGTAANSPFPDFACWGYVSAFGETDDAVIQTAYTYTSDDWSRDATFEKKRYYKITTGWSEWEWVNPPMTVGREYRTTERFYGAPVYKRVLDVGYLGAGVNSFNHGIANIAECVGIEIINASYGLFTAHCDAEFSPTGIYLNMPWAAGGVRLILSYIKN